MEQEKLLAIEDELRDIVCGSFRAYITALVEDGEDEAESISNLLNSISEGFENDPFIDGVISFLDGTGCDPSEEEDEEEDYSGEDDE